MSFSVTAGAEYQLSPTLVTSHEPIGHSTFHATAKPERIAGNVRHPRGRAHVPDTAAIQTVRELWLPEPA